MTRYLVTMAASFSIPVEAEDEEQAREIADSFVEGGSQDAAECMGNAEYMVTDCEPLDPDVYDTANGLDAGDPYNLHDLDGE